MSYSDCPTPERGGPNSESLQRNSPVSKYLPTENGDGDSYSTSVSTSEGWSERQRRLVLGIAEHAGMLTVAIRGNP